jgi:hypothetical protein
MLSTFRGTCFLHHQSDCPDDGGNKYLWNVGQFLSDYTVQHSGHTSLWWWWCRWGETTSLNCGHQRAYCWSPRWYEHGGTILTGRKPDLSTRAFCQSYKQSNLVANQEVLGRNKLWISPSKSLFLHFFEVIFYMPLNLTWGLQLYFPSERRLTLDYYRLKNSSPRLGFNPWTLGPMASTLTITPPRLLLILVLFVGISGVFCLMVPYLCDARWYVKYDCFQLYGNCSELYFTVMASSSHIMQCGHVPFVCSSGL